MFEEATRKKLRFSYKGNISTEDLWDLSVNDLNAIYGVLSKEKKENNPEDSLITVKTERNEALELKMNVVKHVFTVKTQELEAKKNATERRARKRQLQAILANKQDEELKGKSADELKRLIDDLEE